MSWYDKQKIDELKRAASKRTVADSEAELERLCSLENAKREYIKWLASIYYKPCLFMQSFTDAMEDGER